MNDGADTAANLLASLETPTRASAPPRAAAPQAAEDKSAGFAPFGADGMTFRDLLDIINPLQHIPVVSTLYRHLTGDTIDPAARIAGGALFGGVIGAAVSTVDAVVAATTDHDIGDHVLALFTGESPAAADVQLAGAPPKESPAKDALAGDASAAAPPAPAAGGAATEIAEAFARARRESARIARAGGATPPPKPPPAGAGWLSDVMETAVLRYQESAQLARAGAGRALDVVD